MLPKTPSTEPETSFEALGLKWWAYPLQTKLQAAPNWNMKQYKSMQRLSCMNVKPRLHKRKAPPHKRKAPIDGFLATVLSETILFMKVILWL